MLKVLILGLIQGLTEFLPVSSSAHLVIGKELLGLRTSGVTLEVWLHLGTWLAVLVYFRREILELGQALISSRSEETSRNRRLLGALIIGTIPAAVIGLALKDPIEQLFSSASSAAAMLLVTGIILILTARVATGEKDVNLGRGLIVGLAQAVAILPGISRSGSTISAGLFLGVAPAKAAEFSFLLSLPVIGGAFLLDMMDSGATLFSSNLWPAYLLGTAVSFVSGYLSIYFLMGIIRRGRFHLFGLYCLVVGVAVLVYFAVRG